MLLYRPFYEPLKAKLRGHGGLGSYVKQYWENGFNETSSIFEMQSIKDFGRALFSTGPQLPIHAVVDVIFPLLLGVGLILAIYLGTHIHYVLTSVTTLERRILLDRQIALLCSKRSNQPGSTVNPFDQNSLVKNWTQIMGSSIASLFLPIPLSSRPPPLTVATTKKEQ
jgi:hypothetical protein